jgi:hypothetical protein
MPIRIAKRRSLLVLAALLIASGLWCGRMRHDKCRL